MCGEGRGLVLLHRAHARYAGREGSSREPWEDAVLSLQEKAYPEGFPALPTHGSFSYLLCRFVAVVQLPPYARPAPGTDPYYWQKRSGRARPCECDAAFGTSAGACGAGLVERRPYHGKYVYSLTTITYDGLLSRVYFAIGAQVETSPLPSILVAPERAKSDTKHRSWERYSFYHRSTRGLPLLSTLSTQTMDRVVSRTSDVPGPGSPMINPRQDDPRSNSSDIRGASDDTFIPVFCLRVYYAITTQYAEALAVLLNTR